MSKIESCPAVWRLTNQVGSTSGGKVFSQGVEFHNPGDRKVFRLGLRPRRYVLDANGQLQTLDQEHELEAKRQEIEEKTEG